MNVLYELLDQESISFRILADHNLSVDENHRLKPLNPEVSPGSGGGSTVTTPRNTPSNSNRVRSISVINNSSNGTSSVNIVGEHSNASTVSFSKNSSLFTYPIRHFMKQVLLVWPNLYFGYFEISLDMKNLVFFSIRIHFREIIAHFG